MGTLGSREGVHRLTPEKRFRQALEKAFPKLHGTGYRITSPVTAAYNCIGWAAGDDSRSWWPNPDGYWPRGVPEEETVDAFVQALGTVGYVVCKDTRLESGFEKVVLYVDGRGVPTHAARQLPSGKWSSKLGQSYDVEHTLIALQGTKYGKISTFLKRPAGWKPGSSGP